MHFVCVAAYTFEMRLDVCILPLPNHPANSSTSVSFLEESSVKPVRASVISSTATCWPYKPVRSCAVSWSMSMQLDRWALHYQLF